jgi:hypothetical protein
LSLTLILGVGVWGYKLIMRDVTGIPVVRAMEGDMRVLPDNPGGAVALHTGLAVNEVAAMGEAGGLEDRLVLAPRTADLTPEDLQAQPQSDATPVADALSAPVVAQPAPISDPEADTIAALTEALAFASAPPAASPDAIAASVPGVATSLRPALRPAALRIVAPVSAAVATPAIAPVTATTEVAITNETFPVGTNLVQLGAFTTPALAAEEWDRLQSRFGTLMTDRGRVIQVSNQSGGTWYRLRASGFTDRAEARRLCAALQAEGTECIAVVVN